MHGESESCPHIAHVAPEYRLPLTRAGHAHDARHVPEGVVGIGDGAGGVGDWFGDGHSWTSCRPRPKPFQAETTQKQDGVKGLSPKPWYVQNGYGADFRSSFGAGSPRYPPNSPQLPSFFCLYRSEPYKTLDRILSARERA